MAQNPTLLALAAAALLSPQLAHAQEPDQTETDAQNGEDGASQDPGATRDPFERARRILTAPRLSNDIGSLSVGGFVQGGYRLVADSDFNQDDQDGFELLFARLVTRGQVDLLPALSLGFRFDINLGQGNFDPLDVYGSLIFLGGAIQVDFGQIKFPFGYSLVQSAPLASMPLRSEVNRLTFGRDVGLALRGRLNPVGDFSLRYAFMVANGEGGLRQVRNQDNAVLVGGRIDVAPLGDTPKSESDLHYSDPVFSIGGGAAWTPSLGKGLSIADVGASEARWSVDGRFYVRGFQIRAEYMGAQRGDNSAGAGFSRFGFYVGAGYVLPLPIPIQFEPVVRVGEMDINTSTDGLGESEYVIDNTRVRHIDAGLNIFFVEHMAKFQLLYRRTDLLEGPISDIPGDGGPLIDDQLLLTVQVGWL